MSQPKQIRENKTVIWSLGLRPKVGDTVSYNNSFWVNETGLNSEPGVGGDWVKIYIEGIPITGTENDKPVTGDIKFTNLKGIIWDNEIEEDTISEIKFKDTTLIITTKNTNNNATTNITISSNDVAITSNNSNFKGLRGDTHHSSNLTESSGDDFYYVQKKYVDDTKNNLDNYTVATLPAGVEGQIAYVTDADAIKYRATAVGGGTEKVLVFFDGTNWIYH